MGWWKRTWLLEVHWLELSIHKFQRGWACSNQVNWKWWLGTRSSHKIPSNSDEILWAFLEILQEEFLEGKHSGTHAQTLHTLEQLYRELDHPCPKYCLFEHFLFRAQFAEWVSQQNWRLYLIPKKSLSKVLCVKGRWETNWDQRFYTISIWQLDPKWVQEF